ncbi:alcohol acetyltransferase [Xylariaceae sp. FL0804]|nr:alcohol acetyltransferase [Xylariaceae sp. FL0804]
MLQPGLAGQDSPKPCWVRLQQMDMTTMITQVEVSKPEDYDQRLQQVLVEHHNTPFPDLETVPSWRVTAMTPVWDSADFIEVVFAYNHALLDGMSGKIFHQALQRQLHSVSIEDAEALSALKLENHVLELPQDSKLSPPQQDAIKFATTWSFTIAFAWRNIRPYTTPPAGYARWAPISVTPNETTLQLFTTPAADMQRLLVACRRHQTTITGLLQALTLVFFCREIRQQQAFFSTSTIDFRRYIVDRSLQPDSLMGNYVSMFTHKFDEALVAELRGLPLPPTTTSDGDDDDGHSMSEAVRARAWAIAAQEKAHLRSKLGDGVNNDMMGLIGRWLGGDFRVVARNELRKQRRNNWEVSNLGVCDSAAGAGAEALWPLRRLVASQSSVACGAAMLIFPISLRGGDMCTTVTAQRSVVDEALTQALARDLDKWLRLLAREADEP